MMNQTPDFVTVVENGEGRLVQLDEQGQLLLNTLSETWRKNLGLRQSPFSFQDGLLTARDVTGFVHLGDVVVEVVPKFLTEGEVGTEFWRSALWAILARVYRMPVLGSPVPGEFVRENGLPDLLGYVLLISLRANQPNGRPMGYVSETGNLQSLRGRFDVGRIVEVLVHPGTIPCEFDAYSEDVPVNRLLRWSAEQLASAVWSPSLGHDLAEEAFALRGASRSPPSITEAERITLAPHHALLQPAVTVGQLLLAGRGLQHGMGMQALPGFLWKSADVFESFVRLLVQSALRSLMLGSYLQVGRVLIGVPIGNGRELVNTPDVRIVQAGRTVAVLDAKYKAWGTGPTTDDARQVLTGAWVEDCAVCGLIYPSPMNGMKDPMGWHLQGMGNPERLWALFVDLTRMGHPNGEYLLVNDLVDQLVTIAPELAA